MFRILSFLISMGFHTFLCLILMFRGEPETGEVPVLVEPPRETEKELASQDDVNRHDKSMHLEQDFKEQEALQQMRYEVSLKERESNNTEPSALAASETERDGIMGSIDQNDVERTAIPRLVVTNLNRELTDRLIQSNYLIPLIEVRDPLLAEESDLLIQKTGSGYRCHPASPVELAQASSRALPVDFSVENEIRNALIQSSANLSSRERIRFHLSNQLDQMVARRQQEAVKQAGRSAQSKTTYGHFEVSGSRVNFIVDQVK